MALNEASKVSVHITYWCFPVAAGAVYNPPVTKHAGSGTGPSKITNHVCLRVEETERERGTGWARDIQKHRG